MVWTLRSQNLIDLEQVCPISLRNTNHTRQQLLLALCSLKVYLVPCKKWVRYACIWAGEVEKRRNLASRGGVWPLLSTCCVWTGPCLLQWAGFERRQRTRPCQQQFPVLFFRPSCFENNNSYPKHTKEEYVLKILQKMMSVWVVRKPEVRMHRLYLLISVCVCGTSEVLGL